MELKEIFLASGGVILALMTLIQIAPIKVNPWSWLGRAIGRAINGELYAKLDEMRDDIDENEIDRIRWEILDFANSSRNGRPHAKEEFDHIISMHEKYEGILERKHRKNGQVERAYAYIVDLYDHNLREDGFL